LRIIWTRTYANSSTKVLRVNDRYGSNCHAPNIKYYLQKQNLKRSSPVFCDTP
jgi:hypothetical protein